MIFRLTFNYLHFGCCWLQTRRLHTNCYFYCCLHACISYIVRTPIIYGTAPSTNKMS